MTLKETRDRKNDVVGPHHSFLSCKCITLYIVCVEEAELSKVKKVNAKYKSLRITGLVYPLFMFTEIYQTRVLGIFYLIL